jgi:hypothetical protein
MFRRERGGDRCTEPDTSQQHGTRIPTLKGVRTYVERESADLKA